MAEYIKNIYNDERFGFYLRKAFFQGVLPIILALFSFFDFIRQNTGQNTSSFYLHIYFYTAGVLLVYTQIKIILEFIFSTCSENVIFRKEISMDKSISEKLVTNVSPFNESYNSEILVPMGDSMSLREHFIITIKRIFKLRYSDSIYFKFMCKFCWLIGMECPILIPYDIIAKLANAKNSITKENEQQLLHMTLANLQGYHPDKYNIYASGVSTNTDNEKLSLIPKSIITPLDKTIGDLQKEVFHMQRHSGYLPNVV
jgi:hypothetical protein